MLRVVTDRGIQYCQERIQEKFLKTLEDEGVVIVSSKLISSEQEDIELTPIITRPLPEPIVWMYRLIYKEG